MGANTKLKWAAVVLAIASPFAGFLFVKWREATRTGGQKEAEPFRIAGNFYYVGASDVASFLITGPEGHVLIDGGYPGTPPLIMASIAKLGFNIHDVKMLLNSEPHYDHAGGLAELQKASGAEVWASEASAETLVSGGKNDSSATFLPMQAFAWAGLTSYAPVRVEHRVKDGETIRVGSTQITAHITGGHTRGCTTWTFPIRDGERAFNAVSACSMELLPGVSLVEPQNYPGIREDFERTFSVLRSLPMDIWVTSHAKAFGRYRKFVESGKAKDPVQPFVDREGYFAYIAAAEERFKKLLAEQQPRP